MGNEMESLSRYDEVILAVFERLVQQHGENAHTLPFDKGFLDQIANELRIKNVPDIIYSYRSGRRAFPRALLERPFEKSFEPLSPALPLLAGEGRRAG